MKKHLTSLWRLLRLYISAPKTAKIIKQVHNEKLTYLGISALIDIYDQVNRLESRNIEGVFVEAGVALGGSALVIASGKTQQRPLYLYDSFEMIPPPSERDGKDAHDRYQVITSGEAHGIKGEEYYGYRRDLLEEVTKDFQRFDINPEAHKVRFIKGFYDKTMVISEPVALAHIDSDWHDSVLICLQAIVPNVVSGGVIIIDDYNDWSGCRVAVDNYFSDRKNEFTFIMKSRLHIIRK